MTTGLGFDDFEWGVWVSLSEASSSRVTELWEDSARVGEPPYFAVEQRNGIDRARVREIAELLRHPGR
ncbi:DUF2199 domain-containing protein [Amycolatopsis sp. VS8301801F10]|uniref:DUF2199 domain-containing protein n=1 Tax=Amycolatopsis sp. VS8301801F10 TaxID=2652442 RepID=UPI0038FC183E